VVLIAPFLLWACWPGGRDRWLARCTAALALLVVLKIGLSLGAVEPGAVGSYFGRARLDGQPERSSDFRSLSQTRIDQVLTFEGDELPLHFLNDNDRFNFYQPGQPDRRFLPVAASWQGWLVAPDTRPYRLWLSSSGEARLWIDGTAALQVDGGGRVAADAQPVQLAAGPHELQLEYVRRAGQPITLARDWDFSGAREPVAAPYLSTAPISAERLGIERWRSSAATIVDLLARAVLTIDVGRLAWRSFRAGQPGAQLERVWLSLLGGAVSTFAVISSLPLVGRTQILEGGQDWLTYEYYARDILLNGPLMTLGKALGQGRAYVFQPLYPYYLAGIHGLFGEGPFGPQAAQIAGLGLAGLLTWYLARELYDRTAAWTSLVLYGLLLVTQLESVARRLLSENLYFGVLPAALLLCVLAVKRRSWRFTVLAGLLLGIACLTRAPTLLPLPIAAVLLGRAIGWRHGAALVGATLLLMSLVPVRNYVVSGRPALVATNAGATLLLAHTPTPTVRLARIDENPVYNRLGLDRPTREVLEFVRQDPLGYAATLVPLGLYTLGFSGAIDGSSDLAPELLFLAVLYVLVVMSFRGARDLPSGFLHAFVASHFLVMITFLPYVYGYRQVLPLYLAMLPVCGYGLVQVGQLLLRLGGARTRRLPGVA